MKKSELLLNPYKEHLKKPYLHGAGTLEINGVQYSADEYITMLEEANKNLKEKLSTITMVSDDEKQSIEHILELEKENKNLKLTLEQMENTCKDYLNDRDTLREENRKLKEERDFFKEQAILWRKDYKNEYEKNIKLKSDLGTVIDERDNAFNKIKQLEERLDNKEKVNKQLREELGKFVMNNPS